MHESIDGEVHYRMRVDKHPPPWSLESLRESDALLIDCSSQSVAVVLFLEQGHVGFFWHFICRWYCFLQVFVYRLRMVSAHEIDEFKGFMYPCGLSISRQRMWLTIGILLDSAEESVQAQQYYLIWWCRLWFEASAYWCTFCNIHSQSPSAVCCYFLLLDCIKSSA